MSNDPLPCPFCGKVPAITKHFKHEMWWLHHQCPVMGPLSIDWRDNVESLLRTWNKRAK